MSVRYVLVDSSETDQQTNLSWWVIRSDRHTTREMSVSTSALNLLDQVGDEQEYNIKKVVSYGGQKTKIMSPFYFVCSRSRTQNRLVPLNR